MTTWAMQIEGEGTGEPGQTRHTQRATKKWQLDQKALSTHARARVTLSLSLSLSLLSISPLILPLYNNNNGVGVCNYARRAENGKLDVTA